MNPYFPFVFLDSVYSNNTMFYVKTNSGYLSYRDRRILRRESNKSGCNVSAVYVSPEKTDYTSIFTLFACPLQTCGSQKNKIQTRYTLATTNAPLFGSMSEYNKQKEFIFSIPWCSMVYFGCKEQGITNPATYPEWINVNGRNKWILRDIYQSKYLSIVNDQITLSDKDNALELELEPIRRWPDHYYLDFPWLNTSTLVKGQELKRGDCLVSENGKTVLLNSDKLRLLGHRGPRDDWTLHWENNCGDLKLEEDGNLILYNNNIPVWESNTSGDNVRLKVQNDGTLELYDGDKLISSSHNVSQSKHLTGNTRYLRPKLKTEIRQLEELAPGDIIYSKDLKGLVQNVNGTITMIRNNKIIWSMKFNQPISLCLTPKGTLDIVDMYSNLIKRLGEDINRVEVNDNLHFYDKNENIVGQL